MIRTLYSNYTDITTTQEEIMKIVQDWVHTQKTPIPHKEVIEKMESNGAKKITVCVALAKLVSKGYIRQAVHNKSFYVLLRTI
jgi:predicted transcriptional regulator